MDPGADEKRRAFEKEAVPHLDTVYRVALRLAGDQTQAEDLSQETMLKAYRAWHQYRRDKHRGKTVDVAEYEQFTVFHEVQEIDPEGRFFDQIVDEEVLRAIDSLPEEFRECLVLSDMADLSYAEIADVVNVPVGTVKSRLFRARQALKRQLYEYAVTAGYIKRSVR